MKLKPSMIATAIAMSGLTLAMNAIAAPAGELPATLRQGHVSYVMGGVGQTEANAIQDAAKSYPLELEFVLKAKPRNEYLADVKVRIHDAHDRTVLHVTADGPFLLARLPAGKYVISAEHEGKIARRHVEIAANEHRHVVFEWQS